MWLILFEWKWKFFKISMQALFRILYIYFLYYLFSLLLFFKDKKGKEKVYSVIQLLNISAPKIHVDYICFFKVHFPSLIQKQKLIICLQNNKANCHLWVRLF